MSRATSASPVLELVEFGAGGVGKSTLLHRFIYDAYVDVYDPTLEDTYRKAVVINSEVIILECLDIGGQEDYAIMHERASRTGDGFLLVYSVTSRPTLDSVIMFHKMIKMYNKDAKAVPITLVGNKCDLQQERQVSFRDGQQLASELGCKFYETSAKVGTSVEQAYMDLARQMLIHTRERAARQYATRRVKPQVPAKGADKCVIA